MQIGILIFPKMDQMDCTGPFEVLARMPGATVHLLWKELAPIRDVLGFVLTPTATLETELPPLDALVIPGGTGQLALSEDEDVLAWIRQQYARSRYVLSVCTGALILGAAGLLRGRRATTHWNSFELLPYFGATPVRERVVIDGNFLSTAGVSAGIDGSLHLASALCGPEVAQRIQLDIQYAPQPPFRSGDLDEAPPQIASEAKQRAAAMASARREAAQRIAKSLGIDLPADL